VIPQFGSYSGAWARLTRLDAWSWVTIAAASGLYQVSGVWPYQAAMPGLRLRDGLVQIETATAISNTVPAGGAVAIGMAYKMFSSFGFADVVISTAVLTTGIWSFAAKFVLPGAALALLATTEHLTPRVVEAASTGALAMIVLAVLLWLVFRSEASAHWLGQFGDRAVNRALHILGKPASDRIERSLLHFASQTVQTMHRRGWLLTWATLGNQVAGFVLVVITFRAVGSAGGHVTLIALFASFAIARLAGAIPITPGGLGTFDAAFIAMMTTFGASSSQALTTDLIWRLTTYFLPVLCGIATYLIWLRGRERSAVPVAG
jgi:uncharacterized membrane protein YbhN (UPF0104 family)